MEYVEESGLRCGFPSDRYFRFQALDSYRALCGQSLNEMDFVWHHNRTLHLLEIRDYRQKAEGLNLSDLTPATKYSPPYRFLALIDKVTDSIMMLLVARAKTDHGKALATDMPAYAVKSKKIRLVIAPGLPPGLKVHLGVLRDHLNARLKARMALMGVDAISIIDYDQLCKRSAAFGIECQLLTN
jgi:hypothetical protein